MQKNYSKLDIDFLPNRILKEIYEKEQIQNLTLDNISNKLMSTIPDQVMTIADISFNSDINFFNLF